MREALRHDCVEHWRSQPSVLRPHTLVARGFKARLRGALAESFGYSIASSGTTLETDALKEAVCEHA